MNNLSETLTLLGQGKTLSEEQMIAAMNKIMSGEIEQNEISQFLSLLADRGETADEITGAAKVMREKAAAISAPEGTVDCCGTGGDGVGTYNISTAVALVSAACGVAVAKHGNRASSSKSGAADVLEALGVPLSDDKAKLENALRDIGFCFLMAPHHHSAMKYVGPARKALGKKTMFNILGPLANPAGTAHQLIGVYAKDRMPLMAEALNKLGAKKAWLVHGHDGLDEITLTAPTDIVTLENGSITQQTVTAEDFGLPSCLINDLIGGDAQTNATALKNLLEGEKSPYRNIVCANTAATLMVRDKVKTLKDGVKMAQENIDNNKSKQILENYISYFN